MARLPGDEVCAEYEWLVTNGMSAALARETLEKNIPTMARLLYRYGYTHHIAELERERRFDKARKEQKVA
jgi:ketol-acid reductoisomerase